MTNQEWKKLRPGIYVKSKTTGQIYTIMAAFDHRATAVSIADITDPGEWEIFPWAAANTPMNGSVPVPIVLAQPGHEHLKASTPYEKLLLQIIQQQWAQYTELLGKWDALMKSQTNSNA